MPLLLLTTSNLDAHALLIALGWPLAHPGLHSQLCIEDAFYSLLLVLRFELARYGFVPPLFSGFNQELSVTAVFCGTRTKKAAELRLPSWQLTTDRSRIVIKCWKNVKGRAVPDQAWAPINIKHTEGSNLKTLAIIGPDVCEIKQSDGN